MNKIPLSLNRHSSIALYRQLKRILHSQITSGEYTENGQLPSENDLAKAYNVSRHVVRQALKALVVEGRIIPYQGTGYFVNRKRIRKALPRLGSHTESMSTLGSSTQTLVTRREILHPPEYIAKKLMDSLDEQAIFIQRLSYLNEEPVCILEAYYPTKYQDALLDIDLDNKSIYNIFKTCCDVIPGRAETVISVTFTDEGQSTLLQIREGAPLLHIGSFTWSTEEEIFEYSSGSYRSDRFELELRQTT